MSNKYLTGQMFVLPLRCLSMKSQRKGNNKGGQLFGAILHILNRKDSCSLLFLQVFTMKN